MTYNTLIHHRPLTVRVLGLMLLRGPSENCEFQAHHSISVLMVIFKTLTGAGSGSKPRLPA